MAKGPKIPKIPTVAEPCDNSSHGLAVAAIGHASGNENISLYPLFMIHYDVIGHLIRHFSMDNHYKLS